MPTIFVNGAACPNGKTSCQARKIGATPRNSTPLGSCTYVRDDVETLLLPLPHAKEACARHFSLHMRKIEFSASAALSELTALIGFDLIARDG
jgi:hypothetical protein